MESPLAHHKDAIKRMKQNERRRLRNRHYRSSMRTQIKKVRAAVESGDKAVASSELNKAVSIIQRLATKRIIHKRNADRRISRLYQAVNAL
jgi:small subunit ribosomal protein S20